MRLSLARSPAPTAIRSRFTRPHLSGTCGTRARGQPQLSLCAVKLAALRQAPQLACGWPEPLKRTCAGGPCGPPSHTWAAPRPARGVAAAPPGLRCARKNISITRAQRWGWRQLHPQRRAWARHWRDAATFRQAARAGRASGYPLESTLNASRYAGQCAAPLINRSAAPLFPPTTTQLSLADAAETTAGRYYGAVL